MAPPSFHQHQLAGRVGNPNGMELFELGDYFTPNTASGAQDQDSRSALCSFIDIVIFSGVTPMFLMVSLCWRS